MIVQQPMALLSWRTSDGQTGQWQLRQPSARIGRAEGNDLIVPDGSVSSVHAELSLNGGTLAIRDLGSTNGTYVFEQRVQQALLEPGQNFRLGNVEFSFQEEAAAVQTPLPPPPVPVPFATLVADANPAGNTTILHHPDHTPPSVAAGPLCHYHPGSAGIYTCAKCNATLCAACIRMERIGGKAFPFCAHCGGKCVPYGQPAMQPKKARPTFKELLPGCFKYPFKGNGMILLITGTIFFGFLDVITSSPANRIPFIFFMTLLVKAIMYGYLFAFMQKIISSSADGDDLPPDWPEVTDLGQDVFHPFLLFFSALLVAFGPAFLIPYPLPKLLLMLVGAFYFPMALLAVARSDSMAGLNPLIVFSAILKVTRPYIITVLTCGVLVIVRAWVPELVALTGIPIIPTFVFAGVALFLVMVEMRILGVLYYTHKEKFGWV